MSLQGKDPDETKETAYGYKLRDLSGSEMQQFPGLKRDHWWQLWRPRNSPPPPKATLEEADEIPLATASILSKLTFQWVTPIMTKGYQRPLQATDLWKVTDHTALPLSARFLEALELRQTAAQEWNERLSTMNPSMYLKAIWFLKAVSTISLPGDLSQFGSVDTFKLRRAAIEYEWRCRSGRKHGSVAWALNDVMTGFWIGGIFKVASDVSQLMIPLLVKALINFSKEVPQPNIGRGIGMAIGLFFLTIMQSVCQHQFFFRSMAIGVLARATLISAIYKKAMCLSVAGRAKHPNGKLLTYLSSDISRIDYCAQSPIQLIITLILLIIQIGPSALVGFSLFVVLAPLQTWFMKLSFKVRKKSMRWTDSRSRLLRELLSSMEIIKVFTYEIPFLKRLSEFRRKEMIGVRKILVIRAANQALAFSVPALASVLAFVTYAATHDSLDPALIFTSLAFFNLLRQPLMFLPRALSSLTDAQNAIERLTENSHAIDATSEMAILVDNATFSWSVGAQANDAKSFKIPNLVMKIARGKIVAIVGSVGSGKSSLLQGVSCGIQDQADTDQLIGEMSILSGSVIFGGRLSYCQQNAWIQNASVRENILFGQSWNESRYWQAVKDANLMTDLEMFADGDLTEADIDSGINLSGGQKQRVNIARAIYHNAEVVLFDDPLSAVDPHVGKALFENAILPLKAQGKTVVLVTHAIHFLPKVDHIYFMSGGSIAEQGTYEELSQSKGSAAKLFSEFGGSQKDDIEEHCWNREARGSLDVYAGYLHAGRSRYTLPLTLLSATIMQGSQVIATVWLTWWQERRFNQPWNVYQGVYAALGISQAIFTFAMGTIMGILASLASQNLHSSALANVFYSPKSMFDTQPLGRILGVFGKDIDTIDNQLPDSLRMMALTLVTLIGSVIIITVFLHYFIVIIFFVGVGYW
ncbi:hypothetical protein I203_100863 [Kwoniella mangroviensis CBS 8507]|uniref:uncharacterized protein n=1 Tax=Kwoniella mangroviensis CBS 8507 TaxID=1296122 RepID=UPI003036CBD7